MYLELQNISFAYERKEVLKNISFGVDRGEITGLIGANGTGKTTTIYNIVKKLEPQSGEILLNGHLLANLSFENLKMAYIPDEPVFYEELTLMEHVKFVQALYPNTKTDVNKIIKDLELEEHLNKIPGTLSKGTLQKMMIVLALLRDHDLFIADEPFNGLDPKQIKKLKDILNEEKSHGKAVLISTHLLDLAEELCDKYVMINYGKIMAAGTKQDMIQKFCLPKENSLEEVYLSIVNR